MIKKYVNWNRPVKKIKKEEVLGRRVEALESTLSLLREEKECLCVVEATEVIFPGSLPPEFMFRRGRGIPADPDSTACL